MRKNFKMGWFRWNKKKKDKNIKEEKNEDIKELNTSKVKIIVWRNIGKDLFALASEFEADETPDSNTNMIATNEEKKFKEQLSFSKDRVYELLEYNLELKDKDLKTQRAILEKKIKEQEKLIKKFDDEDDEVKEQQNTKYNFQDQDLKLRQLRVLRDELKYKTLGAYERIGKNGIRQYEFVSKDGVLYPWVFGGSKSPRAHPDFTVKKKIFNHENTIFNQQMGLDANKIVTWVAVVMIIVACVWSLGCGFWTYKNWVTGNNLDLKVNNAGIVCNNALATMNNNYANYITDYPNIKQDIETLKKKEDNNINKNNQITINPDNNK